MNEEASAPGEKLSVYHVLMAFVDQMSAIAWQKMGLQPDPITGKTEKDLKEAKVAVDVTAGLAAYLEKELDDEDKRQIHNLVRDLQVNYLEKSKEAK